MTKVITYGRYPTLGEVCAYYSRRDFLEFLLGTCAARRVVLVIPKRRRWEPDWDRDRVCGDDVATLRELVVGRIRERFDGQDRDQRLPYYPSFHQSVERWRPGGVDTEAAVGRDGVCEADLPDWRLAFEDVFTLLSVLRDEGIPHRFKFSGHRSLHVVVPYGTERLQASRFGGSGAHSVEILRMPFSLNEDTGLVSLPLDWDALRTFRPWQASPHAVEIRQDWLQETGPEEREKVAAFVAGLGDRPEESRRPFFNSLTTLPELRRKACAPRLQALAPVQTPSTAPGMAWRRLCGLEPISASDLVAAWRHGSTDVRWLTTEAFVMHGEALPEDFVKELTETSGVYLRPAALDLLQRFADKVRDYFLRLLAADEMGPEDKALSVLRRAGPLRTDILDALGDTTERTGAMALRLACVTGAILNNWDAASAMVAAVESEHAGEPRWQARVQALRHMVQFGRTWWSPGVIATGRLLAELGTEVIDLLLLAMASPDHRFRRTLIAALSMLGDERALDVLVEHLASRHYDIVRWATRGLMRIGPAAVSSLLEAAASDDARLRRYAIRCLGHLREPGTREALLGALEDADEAVCRQAVIALGKIGEESDVGALVEVIRTRTWRTAEAAVASLALLGAAGPAALRALALEEGEPAAAVWLWQQGDIRGKSVLMAALHGPPRKRTPAVLALASGPVDEAVLDVFVRFLEESVENDREIVAEALVRTGHPKVRQLLMELARHSGQFERKLSARHLSAWDDPAAVETLVHLLGDKNRKVQSLAEDGVKGLGESARGALASAVVNAKSARRRGAARALLRYLDVVARLHDGGPLDGELIEAVIRHNCLDPAAAILQERGSADALGTLVQQLENPNRKIARGVSELLRRIGGPVRPVIERFLAGNPSPAARADAEKILQELDAQEEPD